MPSCLLIMIASALAISKAIILSLFLLTFRMIWDEIKNTPYG